MLYVISKAIIETHRLVYLIPKSKPEASSGLEDDLDHL